MTGPVAHACRYRVQIAWSEWERDRTLRERSARRVPICPECGGEQPARRPRTPILIEREAANAERLAVPDASIGIVAGALLRRATGKEVRARGFFGALAAQGLPGSVAEPTLDALMRGGIVRLRERTRGRRVLDTVVLLDCMALEELARPGEREARNRELAAALGSLDGLDHPVVEDARRVLDEESLRFSPALIRAVAAVARHAAGGEVLAERVFAARYLGSSKALGPLRLALERLLGPLASLGIREGGGLVLIGGPCRIGIAAGEKGVPIGLLDVGVFTPYVGISREAALGVEWVTLPPAGLVAVENLSAFEACCRGEVSELADAAFVWTAGYPGRAVRALVEAASRRARVRAWADLDLDGVRIARIVAGWARDCGFHRMEPENASAFTGLPLALRARVAVARDLAMHPGEPLAETLRAILTAGRWVEQEEMLGK